MFASGRFRCSYTTDGKYTKNVPFSEAEFKDFLGSGRSPDTTPLEGSARMVSRAPAVALESTRACVGD